MYVKLPFTDVCSGETSLLLAERVVSDAVSPSALNGPYKSTSEIPTI
jgi:hypothetical protein